MSGLRYLSNCPWGLLTRNIDTLSALTLLLCECGWQGLSTRDRRRLCTTASVAAGTRQKQKKKSIYLFDLILVDGDFSHFEAHRIFFTFFTLYILVKDSSGSSCMGGTLHADV